MDPKKLETETGNFKCGDYDDYGVCKDNGYIYFDGTDSYGMARARDVGADFFPGVLSVAFEKNWTTPQELYLDAQGCAFKAESQDQTNATELDMGCAVSEDPPPPFRPAPIRTIANIHSPFSRIPLSVSLI